MSRSCARRSPAIDRRPFWFMIDRIVRNDHYLYAEPSDGAAELTELYDALNPSRRSRSAAHDARPVRHAAEAEQVARIVGRQHLPIHGRVEELALLRRTGKGLDNLRRCASSEVGAARRALLLAVALLFVFGRPIAWTQAALIMWDVAAGGSRPSGRR